MDVIRNLLESDWRLPASVVGVGTFDGVHVAHQALLRTVAGQARALGVPSVVLTFDPHPMEVLRPGFAGRLLSAQRKLVEIGRAGVDTAIVLPFSLEFARTEPEDFVDELLLGRLGAREVVVGFNFTFGYRARGTPHLLEELGERNGFVTHVVAPYTLQGEPVSSSAIRQLLAKGDVEGAARLLGRLYALEGDVVRGEGRGRQLGFPTANLQVVPDNAVVPGRGVYAGTATLEGGETHGCAINVGNAPTFGDGLHRVEVHLLDFSGELTGRRLRVQFRRRLRDERAFADGQELAEQIRRDVAASRLPSSAPIHTPARPAGALRSVAP
ncbi:MAG: bifunctional riboflavin kinase/FAD synthetase [Candidatus Wallbacteria bacterium]|nr:bifunctional riboflavin kinase/FAD synthetase [Candidatus Wallbacteria bacterium]